MVIIIRLVVGLDVDGYLQTNSAIEPTSAEVRQQAVDFFVVLKKCTEQVTASLSQLEMNTPDEEMYELALKKYALLNKTATEALVGLGRMPLVELVEPNALELVDHVREGDAQANVASAVQQLPDLVNED